MPNQIYCQSRLPSILIGASLVLIAFGALVSPAMSLSTKNITGDCRKDYNSWKKRGGYGAFAISRSGYCGFSWDSDTSENARSGALQECRKRSKNCEIVAELKTPSEMVRVSKSCAEDTFSEKGRQACERVIALDPKNSAWAYGNLGMYYEDVAHDIGKSLELFKKAVRIKDGRAEVDKKHRDNVERLQKLVDDQRRYEQELPGKPDHSICNLALSSSKNSWESNKRYSREVAEVRRRGLSVGDCRVAIGILPTKDTAANNSLSARPVEAICNAALVSTKAQFSEADSFQPEVTEAKRRGLSVDDCRIVIGLAPLNGSPAASSLAARQVEAICTAALVSTKTQFSEADSFRPEVDEAKRRGLSVDDCRVTIGLEPLNGSLAADSFAARPIEAICTAALVSTKTQFSEADSFQPEVTEAKRRGLSVDNCRVAIGLAPLNGSNVQPNEVSQQTEPKLQNLSLSEICEQSLNTERSDWNSSASAIYARKQADALGITIDVCRVKLGITQEQQIAQADDVTPPTVQPDAIAGRRVALVVGINDYENLPKLQKAVNDSRAVSQTLASIGYEVVSVENPDRRTLSKKLSELQSKIQPGDNALFYFAGHGVALGGENILIAKDMPKPASGDEDLVRDEGFSVDDIVRRIQKQGAKTAFLVLDACRDNPFEATGTRSIGTTRGLAKTDTPSGVFVLFSAGIGQAALDRLSDTDSDPNSVFTRELLPVLGKKGLTLTGLAKAVQKDVADLAATISHQQQPAYYDQIIGEVVINPQ